MGTELFDPVKTMSRVTDSVIVDFSTGKESIATLDLCFRYFKRVQPYYLYTVPNLEFQEKVLRWYENKYECDIIRLPAECVSEYFRYGCYRIPDMTFPVVSEKDIMNYIRIQTGIWWCATGERIDDSIQRRAMIKHSGTISDVNGRMFPVATWNKREILEYIKFHKLKIGRDSQIMGHSARVLQAADLLAIRENFPEDYEKIIHIYPLADSGIKRLEEYGKKQISSV